MSLTDVMDDVDYTRKNFNEIETMTEHPPWMTESHFVYHLQRSTDNGQFSFIRDTQGEPLCSPRPLALLSMQPMVVRPCRMKILKGRRLSPDLYPSLLTEAIFQRSLQTVSFLVSTWPRAELKVHELLPLEDLERFQQLTEPFDTALSGGMSLCDAFMAGLLNIQPASKLRFVSFAGFWNDRKLCRELLRLPILWIKPDHRDPEFIHGLLNQEIGISQEDVERYLNRINCIYASVDRYVKHGHDLPPITVELDCRVSQDDVAIGLALQFKTPFSFRCSRVWLDPATEFAIPVNVLQTVLQPEHITHLEMEDPDLCKISSRWQDFNSTLPQLTALKALSLPNTIHVNLLEEAAHKLSETLQNLRNLRRVNLSSCTLRDSLGQLLKGLGQGVTYLSLRDCRLTQTDVQHLLEWPGVSQLQEVNLSRNNLQGMTTLVKELLHKVSSSIVCLSLSYTSIPPADLQEVAQACQECKLLKVLALQSFTPPLPAQLSAIIESCSRLPVLQRCVVFPETYAFPGRQISQRAANRASIGLLCCELLSDVGRSDIQLE
ncbi:leucine-rich repeat-containing protein 14-like [Babylonia areolata]|uniref:leucine-rich repeat-containing protein 14-like n=1 Tax=Babylonia areolata TaxID=304850 RepID=UPI003FD1D7C4